MSREGIRTLERAFEQVLSTRVRADTLNTRIQGLSVHPAVIKKEMQNKHSPFMWKGPGGYPILNVTQRNATAKEISDVLYSVMREEVIKRGGVPFTGGNIPRGFTVLNKRSDKKYGYDDRRRIIYFYSSGDVFRSFTESFIGSWRAERGVVFPRIKRTYPPSSAVYVFLNPNERWENLKKLVGGRARARALAQGKSSSRADAMRTQAIARLRERYRSKGFLDYEGVQFGHTFGAAATGAAYLLDNPDDLAHQNIDAAQLIEAIQSADVDGTVLENVRTIIREDTNLKWERIFNSSTVEGRVTLLVPEDTIMNNVSGSKTSAPLNLLRQFVRSIESRIADLSGSPSYNKLVEQLIEDLFLGKTPKRGKHSVSSKITHKTESKATIRKISGGTGVLKSKRTRSKQQSEGVPLNLRSLISLVNRKMHDKVRENMGKGGAEQILNYQTGRFAKSIKVQDLYGIGEKNALGAKVKYMRYPYGVFEPGGKLYRAGRDPHGIIGRSIRQILQEEKIANLRRVKVTLNG